MSPWPSIYTVLTPGPQPPPPPSYHELDAAALVAEPPTQLLRAQPVVDPPTLRFARPVIPAQRAPAGGTAAAFRTTVSTVTVIVPAHNEEAGHRVHDRGPAQPDAPDWLQITDVVVVVNNCTDRTAEIARRYPVTVLEMLHNTHKKSGAMNHGWQQHGRGSDFVLTMDADTVLLPDTVEDGQELVENPVLGAVCARYWAKEGRGLVRRCSAWSTRGTTTCASCGVAGERGQRRRRDVPPGALQEVAELGAARAVGQRVADRGLRPHLDLKAKGWRVGAAREAHVYTEPPTRSASCGGSGCAGAGAAWTSA